MLTDIRTIQELLGHHDVRTTMIDTHVLNRGGLGVGARWMGYRDRAGGGVGTGAPATAGGRGRKVQRAGPLAIRLGDASSAALDCGWRVRSPGIRVKLAARGQPFQGDFFRDSASSRKVDT